MSLEEWREPFGYRDRARRLVRGFLLPPELLARFQDMASFRNLLVYRYDKIDDEVVFGAFAKRLPDFLEFAELVGRWVCRHDCA